MRIKDTRVGMSRSLTDILKGLAIGLLAIFVVLMALGTSADAARVDDPAPEMSRAHLSSQHLSGSLCHHQLPKKHRCKLAPRAAASMLDPVAKRKCGEPVASASIPLPDKQLGIAAASSWNSGPHLHLSYNAVYATTRRMHI